MIKAEFSLPFICICLLSCVGLLRAGRSSPTYLARWFTLMCQGSPLVSQSLRPSFYQILRCLADLMRILNRHKGIKHVWCWNLRQVDIIGRNPFGRAVFFLGTVEVAESITVIQVVVSEAEQLSTGLGLSFSKPASGATPRLPYSMPSSLKT